METHWFIHVADRKEGPYTVNDLKRHPAVTPDTLVWTHGWADWRPIRKVAELDEVFEDDESDASEDEETALGPGFDVSSPEVLVASGPALPPYIVLLILIGIVIYLILWMLS